MALINGSEPEPTREQFCGGSLISANWVLTAAHCFYDPDTDVRDDDVSHYNVVSGTTRYAQGGVRSNVAEIVIHPGYHHATSENDIALMRLTAPVAQRPVRLALSDADLTANLIASGWGDTSEGGQGSDVLLQVTLPLVSNAVCNEALAIVLCAGPQQGGKDTCQGDSGGPLVTADRSRQVGIVSHGEGCARAGNYGVYTRISSFRGWINGIVPPPHVAIEAGPIWSNDDANAKCPGVAQSYGGIWTGNWWTTVASEMSVCELEL